MNSLVVKLESHAEHILGAAHHTCSICGKVALWDAGWRSWGSLAYEENGAPMLKFCSDQCARRIPERRFAGILSAAFEKAETNRVKILRNGYIGPRVIEIEVEL